MPGFDITSILDFQPPKYICPHCRGLFNEFKWRKEKSDENPWGVIHTLCPVCSSEFVKGEWAPKNQGAHHYLREFGYTVEYGKDLFEHARALASLIRNTQGNAWEDPWPIMRLFFEVLSRARHFVHFTSWGISHLMIGALKVTSMRVPVFGFVSNVADHARMELTEFPAEAPNLKAQVIQSKEGVWDAPHQKLVIIDSLLAFKGSTNLTNNAMRKADRGLDLSEVVTDFEKVADLNNRYFAPVWKNLSHPTEKEIVMWDTPF